MRRSVLTVALSCLLGASVLSPVAAQAQQQKPEPLKLKVGDTAPDFHLKYFDGAKVQDVSLSDFKGKKNVVLAFFVFAFTGGWTQEMRNLQANYDRLQAADTQVLGVSVDSPFANKAFADSVGAKFPIASDYFDNDETIKAYGLWNDKFHSARRASFLIGKDGKIEEMQVDSKAIDPNNIVEACERKKHGQ